MNDITPTMLDDDKKKRIAEYIGANNISKKDILKYASVFPDKVMRNLIESEAIFCVAKNALHKFLKCKFCTNIYMEVQI